MAIVISCGVLLAVSLLVGSVMPFLPLARFEFARSLLIVILFARVYLATAFWGGLTSSFSWGRASAALGAVVALSLYAPLYDHYLSPSRVGAVVCAVVAVVVLRRSVMHDQLRGGLAARLAV